MAHELFDGRYVGRKAAWHGLGTVVEDRDLTAIDAVGLARLDYKVFKAPMKITLPNGAEVDADRFALVREPTADDAHYRTFSVVTEDYSILQNADVFGVLNPLSEKWPVETAGAIEDGARAFMSLKAGEYEVKGRNGGSDAVELFYLVTNSFTGATRIAFTPVRVVCKNTLSLSEKDFTVSANVRHKGAAMMEFTAMAGLVAKLQGVQSEAIKIFEAMGRTMIESADVNAIIEAAYPMPRKARKLDLLNPVEVGGEGAVTAMFEDNDPMLAALRTVAERHEYNAGRIGEHHAKIRSLVEWYDDTHPAFGGTAWNAWNAVVDYADHVQSGGNRAENAVFGARATAKAKAFKVAAELASAN